MSDRRRINLLAVAFALVLPSIVTWAYFVWLTDAPEMIQRTAYSAGKALQFAFPAVWVVIVLRDRPRASLGSARDAAWGAAFGLVVLAATATLYHLGLKSTTVFAGLAVVVEQKVAGMGLSTPLRYIGLAVFYSLLHSLMEEYYWRWFVFGYLRRMTPLPAALLVSSIGFMAHHVIVLAVYFGWTSPLTWLFSLCVAVGGAVWAWLYERSGSLVAPWLSHLLVDAAIFLIGYDLLQNVWA